MKKINELVGLMHQVSAVLDEANEGSPFGVIGVDITNQGRVKVHLLPEMFYENFHGFRIQVLENRKFKFRLLKVVQGVEFVALTNDLSGLKKLRLVERNGIKKSLHALQCG